MSKSWTLEQAQIKHHILNHKLSYTSTLHFWTGLWTHIHMMKQQDNFPEVGAQISFSVHKSQILKFLGSFRYRKSANFFDVQVCKSQLRNFFLQITNPQF